MHHSRAWNNRELALWPLLSYTPARSRVREVGDVWVGAGGYLFTKAPDGRILGQHRYVMEQQLGRRLIKGETVHHLNGVRDDNRLENLQLWFSPQPYGQRVEDLLRYVAEYHAEAVLDHIKRRTERRQA